MAENLLTDGRYCSWLKEGKELAKIGQIIGSNRAENWLKEGK